MDIRGVEPSTAKTTSGVLALVFKKIIWSVDKDVIAELQNAGVIAKAAIGPRALNTKVLAFAWTIPRDDAAAQAQRDALSARDELSEAHAFAIDLSKVFLDDVDKPRTYLDGGELTLAFARGVPERIAEAMPYLRAPQRADWFMDDLARIAADTKDAKARACIYDAIAQMPVPPKSNKHHKTYVAALGAGAEAFRAAGDKASAQRLEEKSAMFGKKKS
jgi:hypothetical protein